MKAATSKQKLGEWGTTDVRLLQRWKKYEEKAHERGERIGQLLNKALETRSATVIAQPTEEQAEAVLPSFALRDARLLDVGGGGGGISAAMSSLVREVVCLERDWTRMTRGVERLGERGVNVSFCSGDAHRLPFPSDSFDIVLLNDIIEHLPNPRKCIEEVSRILRKGGLVYLFSPNRTCPRHILNEPHYGLAGISLMPRSLAAYYVMHVRKRSDHYDVFHFPTFRWAVREFSRCGVGMQLLASDYAIERLRKLEHTDLFPDRRRRYVANLLNGTGLVSVLRSWILFRIMVRKPNLEFVGTKGLACAQLTDHFLDLTRPSPGIH